MPDIGDERVRFVRSPRDCGNGFVGMNQGVNDKMEGNDNKI